MNNALEVSPRDYHTRLLLNRADIFDDNSWLSKSALWQLKKCSLNVWRNNPPEFTGNAGADWGTVIDCLVTTPDELEDIVAIRPDTYPALASAKKGADIIQKPWSGNAGYCKKWMAENEGKVIMTEEVMTEARKAAQIMMDDPIAGPMIRESKKQVILLTKLKGVNFKCLLDLLPPSEYLCDIKTTADLSPNGISKRIDELGYHGQAGLYLKAWNTLFPDERRQRFRHIWQSSKPPYEVAVTELTSDDIHAGLDTGFLLMDRLIGSAKSKRWPNIFGDKVVMVARPQYAMFRDDEEHEGFIEAPKLRGGSNDS